MAKMYYGEKRALARQKEGLPDAISPERQQRSYKDTTQICVVSVNQSVGNPDLNVVNTDRL
jgi:hypothetical protein